MSGNGRFRYPLEPVLLTRQWDLDVLLFDLGQANATLSKRKKALFAVHGKIDACAQERQRHPDRQFSIDRLVVLTNYLQDLAKQRLAMEQEIAQLTLERDALAERVVAARRGVEAVERHREETMAKFIRQRLNHDFKAADDHWAALQAREEEHGSES